MIPGKQFKQVSLREPEKVLAVHASAILKQITRMFKSSIKRVVIKPLR